MKHLAQPGKFKLFTLNAPLLAIIRLKSRPRKKSFYKRYLVLRRKFYNSPEWKALSLKVRQKAGFTCRICHNGNTQVEAHHIQPIYYFPELALCISNLICLCKKCHRDIHKEAKVA